MFRPLFDGIRPISVALPGDQKDASKNRSNSSSSPVSTSTDCSRSGGVVRRCNRINGRERFATQRRCITRGAPRLLEFIKRTPKVRLWCHAHRSIRVHEGRRRNSQYTPISRRHTPVLDSNLVPVGSSESARKPGFNKILPKRTAYSSACAVYSDPIRAPFSATERFISSTTNTSATMTTASTQNTSK